MAYVCKAATVKRVIIGTVFLCCTASLARGWDEDRAASRPLAVYFGCLQYRDQVTGNGRAEVDGLGSEWPQLHGSI